MCSFLEVCRCGLVGLMSVVFLLYFYFAEEEVVTTVGKVTTGIYTMPTMTISPTGTGVTHKTTSKRKTSKTRKTKKTKTKSKTTKKTTKSKTKSTTSGPPIEPIICPTHNNTRKNSLYFCYINSRSLKRWKGNARYTMLDTPVCLCTHLIYCCASVTANGYLTGLKDKSYRNSRNHFDDFVDLKRANKEIKLMLSLGGYNRMSNFTKMVQNVALRANLIKDVMSLMKTHSLSGLDLYYPDPTYGGARRADYFNLCTELKDKLGKTYLLTLFSIPFDKDVAPVMDVARLNPYIDYFLLKTFDFYTASNSYVTGVTYMYQYQATSSSPSLRNMEDYVNNWIKLGADRKKIIIGVSLHGNTFKLASPADNALGLRHKGYGERGPYRISSYTWTYLEICETMINQTDKWVIVEGHNYAYAYSGHQWIAFENTLNVYAKGRYSKLRGFPGLMFHAVDEDDFGGYCTIRNCTVCNDFKYPLIHSATKGYESYDDKNAVTTL